MKELIYGLVVAAFAATPSNSSAQQTPLVVGQAAPANLLQRGTEIQMITLQELSSQEAKVGDRFGLEVVQDVKLAGRTVIQAGTRGVGEVTAVKKKGMWGKSGKLQTRLLYLEIGDRRLRISGAAGDRGKTGTAGVVASVVLLPLAGFFVTGTSAVIPPRTSTVATLDEDVPVAFAGPVAAQPLVVATPVQPPQ